jgi:divalent metal cation (Fe/Co/Zn/Cd) transporter
MMLTRPPPIMPEPGVVRLNEALTMHFGPRDVLVALSLDFEDTIPAGRVESSVTNIERRIKAAHPEVSRVFVEAQSFDAYRQREDSDGSGERADEHAGAPAVRDRLSPDQAHR